MQEYLNLNFTKKLLKTKQQLLRYTFPTVFAATALLLSIAIYMYIYFFIIGIIMSTNMYVTYDSDTSETGECVYCNKNPNQLSRKGRK